MNAYTYTLTEYAISEEQFENLAREYLGTADFPAGDHAKAHVRFNQNRDYNEQVLSRMLWDALQSYKLKQ